MELLGFGAPGLAPKLRSSCEDSFLRTRALFADSRRPMRTSSFVSGTYHSARASFDEALANEALALDRIPSRESRELPSPCFERTHAETRAQILSSHGFQRREGLPFTASSQFVDVTESAASCRRATMPQRPMFCDPNPFDTLQHIERCAPTTFLSAGPPPASRAVVPPARVAGYSDRYLTDLERLHNLSCASTVEGTLRALLGQHDYSRDLAELQPSWGDAHSQGLRDHHAYHGLSKTDRRNRDDHVTRNVPGRRCLEQTVANLMQLANCTERNEAASTQRVCRPSANQNIQEHSSLRANPQQLYPLDRLRAEVSLMHTPSDVPLSRGSYPSGLEASKEITEFGHPGIYSTVQIPGDSESDSRGGFRGGVPWDVPERSPGN